MAARTRWRAQRFTPDRCLRSRHPRWGSPLLGVAGLDFLEGMGPENIDEFGAALQG